MTRSSIKGFINVFRPAFLFSGILLYALGAGIAHFLGNNIDWRAYWLGQACVTLLQFCFIFLKAFFHTPVVQPELKDENQPKGASYPIERKAALIGTVTILTVGAVLTALLYRNGSLHLETFTILGVAFLIALFYATPPINLFRSGYGELASAIFISNLVPAFAFLLQAGEFHRVLAMATFPLTPIYLAMTLAFDLSSFTADMKNGVHTLLIKIGWQRGMSLHNLLILAGFLLITLAMVFGLPWRISWPAFLALPVGLFQIWQMIQIKEGGKPRWGLLCVNAMATYALMAYLFAFTFWIG
jgi:1,4-dihydroxy-2-naphthoate octaprenyltransferase